MFFRSGRSGSVTPANTVTLGLVIFMFMIGAELFQLYAIRQDMLTLARNIAEFGASQGRFVSNDISDADALDEYATVEAMDAYYSNSRFESMICKRCQSVTFAKYVHTSSANTSSCVMIGDNDTDYLFPMLTGTCGGGRNWVTSAPSTGVLLIAEIPSVLPFWGRNHTVRVFGTATVYTKVPAGKDVFPWLR